MDGFASVMAITVICYLVGAITKAIPNVKDEIIPIVVGIAGGIIGVIAMTVAPDIIPATNYIDAIAIGVVSGLASTGVNQIGKQLTK